MGAFSFGKEDNMTVQNVIVKNIYAGNGSNVSWPYTFACPEDHPEYIKVYIKDTEGNVHETEDFKVDTSTKTVTYPVAGKVLSEEEKIVVSRLLPLHQVLNLVNQGPFFAEDVEVTFDELVMMIQQLNEKLERTMSFSIDVDQKDFNPNVPIAAGKSFRINNEGTGFEVTADPEKVYNDCLAISVNVENDAAAAQEAANEAKSLDNTIYVGTTAPTDMPNAFGWINPEEDSDTTKELTDAVNEAKTAAATAENAKNKVVEIAPSYQRAEQALLDINRLAEETRVNANSAEIASNSAVQVLRDANLINNSGNADLLSAQNATDIIETKGLLTKELANLKAFWNVYDNTYSFSNLAGYIRGKTVSNAGGITASSTRMTFYFQVQNDCKMYVNSSSSSVAIRVSDNEPQLGTSVAWTGTLYTLADINSEQTAVDVKAGQYIAFCNSSGTSVSSTKVLLSYEAYALQDTVGLTKTMQDEVKDIHNNDTDYLKFAIDKVLCIGDSLTAGSSYEIRDGSLHWLGNIKQNYPYFYLGCLIPLVIMLAMAAKLLCLGIVSTLTNIIMLTTILSLYSWELMATLQIL